MYGYDIKNNAKKREISKNHNQKPADWQFTSENARIPLRLYPYFFVSLSTGARYHRRSPVRYAEKLMIFIILFAVGATIMALALYFAVELQVQQAAIHPLPDKSIDPDRSVRGGSWRGLGTIQSVHGDHYTGAHHSPKSIINTRKIPVDKSHGAW